MQFFLKSVGLVLVYLAVAKLGLVFGTVHGSATIFWPPGGIALAALLLGGVRYLPAVLLAAWLTGLMVHAPPLFALGSAMGNTLETFIGYYLLGRFGRLALPLGRSRDLFLIIAVGALIPSIASAIIGPVSLLAAGLIAPTHLAPVMWRWWRADVLGIAFFTPFVLVFAQQRPTFPGAEKAGEMLLLWAISIAVGLMVFLAWIPPGVDMDQAPGLAWIFPLTIWAGVRTGRRNAALIAFMFLSMSMASAYLGVGVFADDFARYGLVNFWGFAMLLSVAGIALAVLVHERGINLQQTALQAKIFQVSNDGVMIVDANNNILSVNPSFTEITGFRAKEVIGKNPRLLSSGNHSREFFADMWQALNASGQWQGEIWNRRKDGVAFLEKLSIQTVTNARNLVVHRIGIFTDITQIKAASDAVAYQAQHDFLTNLPNRLLFSDRFKQQLATAKRHDMKFAVICLDLDKFKPVNDTLGHAAGDQLLVAVASKLMALVREIDTVSRTGGDEFAVLVSEVSEEWDVITLAQKILAELRLPIQLGADTVSISASLGIALYPDHGTDMETIMNRADTALYQAKRNGKNTAVVAVAPEPVI